MNLELVECESHRGLWTLTRLRTTANMSFAPDQSHPFALECRTGVTVDRVKQWLARMDTR